MIESYFNIFKYCIIKTFCVVALMRALSVICILIFEPQHVVSNNVVFSDDPVQPSVKLGNFK